MWPSSLNMRSSSCYIRTKWRKLCKKKPKKNIKTAKLHWCVCPVRVYRWRATKSDGFTTLEAGWKRELGPEGSLGRVCISAIRIRLQNNITTTTTTGTTGTYLYAGGQVRSMVEHPQHNELASPCIWAATWTQPVGHSGCGGAAAGGGGCSSRRTHPTSSVCVQLHPPLSALHVVCLVPCAS